MTALDIAEPRLSADEPSFDVFWEATQERTPVEFDYRRAGATRHHHPPAAAVGRRPLLRSLVRRRPRHRPRRGAGLPALPGRRARRARPARRGRTTSPPGTDVRATDRAPRAAADHRRGGPAGPRRRRGRAAPRRRRRSSSTWPAPTTARGWDRVAISRGGPGSPTRCSATAPTSTSRRPPTLRRIVVEPADAPRSGRRDEHASAGRRQGPGRPAAHPGALPPRPRPGAARRRRRGARRAAPSRCSPTSRCC